VTGIALLPILKVGGMQLFRTESSDKGDKELRNATMFASVTLQIYLGLIVVCALVYAVGGMNAFDAVTHAMTTLSTGGYSGYDASFGHFDSPFLQWSATLFMLLGALPFAWYVRGIYRGSFKSEQVKAMLWSLAAVIIVLAMWLAITNDLNFFDALRLVAFNVVSVVTTTGYATTDYTLWGPFAVAVFFVLTAVGGCTGSTAGGAKAMRWLLAGRAIIAQVKIIQSPSRLVSIKYEQIHPGRSGVSAGAGLGHRHSGPPAARRPCSGPLRWLSDAGTLHRRPRGAGGRAGHRSGAWPA
jgi:trk system potassium uptake protein TrkH